MKPVVLSEAMRGEAQRYRCVFAALQLASVLQHGVHHVPGPSRLPLGGGDVQEVLPTHAHAYTGTLR